MWVNIKSLREKKITWMISYQLMGQILYTFVFVYLTNDVTTSIEVYAVITIAAQIC